MPTDVLMILGALLLVSVIGFAIAWIALTPTVTESKAGQLELTLSRIEREVQSARDLVRAGR